MAKQQFKSQADICKKSLDILQKAIELDPGNAEEYQAGIAYTEGVLKASNAIVKAFDVVEPPKDKTEDATKEEKPKRTRKTKTTKEPAPVDSKPTADETQPMVEPSVEENPNIFSMFDD